MIQFLAPRSLCLFVLSLVAISSWLLALSRLLINLVQNSSSVSV